MDNQSGIVEVLQALGPVLGVVSVVVGTALVGFWQNRTINRQTDIAHQHEIDMLRIQQEREEDVRLRQYAESDHADRLLVTEYVDLLIPRLCDISSIYYIASDSHDEDELRLFKRLQQLMLSTTAQPAHPQANLGLRVTFLIFQLSAAMRLAMNARWTRPLTEEQSSFLSHWESDLEPIMSSVRYPGAELLYREQMDIITDLMIIYPEKTRITRPTNWAEFVREYDRGEVLQTLSESVADKIRYIFEESNPLPPRRAMQCRLAIMALYLIRLSKEAGNDSWNRREPALWNTVSGWFAWEYQHDQRPTWFVFEFGDVAKRAGVWDEAATPEA